MQGGIAIVFSYNKITHQIYIPNQLQPPESTDLQAEGSGEEKTLQSKEERRRRRKDVTEQRGEKKGKKRRYRAKRREEGEEKTDI